jgi:hypothetical protein
MAHPNLENRRNEIARLQRYNVAFERPVVEAIAREFNCSVSTIRNDLRVVQFDSEFRARLDAIWREVH